MGGCSSFETPKGGVLQASSLASGKAADVKSAQLGAPGSGSSGFALPLLRAVTCKPPTSGGAKLLLLLRAPSWKLPVVAACKGGWRSLLAWAGVISQPIELGADSGPTPPPMDLILGLNRPGSGPAGLGMGGGKQNHPFPRSVLEPPVQSQ